MAVSKACVNCSPSSVVPFPKSQVNEGFRVPVASRSTNKGEHPSNISAVAESNVSAEDPSEFLNNENNRNHAKVGIPTSSYINELKPEVLFHNETSQGASAPSSSTVAPDWFDGTIPEEGVVIFSGDNKSKITLNPIETAIYQLAERCSTLLADLLKSVDKGEADKTILQAPMYLDLKSQLIQAKLWLKENKIEFLENL